MLKDIYPSLGKHGGPGRVATFGGLVERDRLGNLQPGVLFKGNSGFVVLLDQSCAKGDKIIIVLS